MDKTALLAALIESLREEVESHARAARAAQEAATDPQSKAENKYDTRGLESSYLARGQALRVAEMEEALVLLRALVLPPPGVALVGSLVGLSARHEERWYFLSPAAGGRDLPLEGRRVWILTPASPLGSVLLNRRPGERFRTEIGGMGEVSVTSVL